MDCWGAIIHHVFGLKLGELYHCCEMWKHTEHFGPHSLAIVLTEDKKYEFYVKLQCYQNGPELIP